MTIAPHKLVVALLAIVLITTAPICEAKRSLGGSSRKSSSGGGYSTRRQPSTSVTKPSYNTNSGSSSGNSHADLAKLSYPNYNSQPNRPASAPTSNNQPIGWNVPNQGNAGPPPAYSASNVAGGAKTNMHEPPPAYQKPNYGAPPPSYNQATGTNYGGAPQYHNSAPAGATYHSPNNIPPGASYYNNPSQVPGGAYPGGYGGYHSSAGMHPGGSYYPPPQSMPPGASYVPAGSALPAGAIMYSAPPQQTSSGLGFGSGLAAGALGGAILGHVLTPTQTRVVEHAPPAAGGSSDGGNDRIIIINNGQPINATDANGITVINNGVTQAPAAAVAGETPAPLAPMTAAPADTSEMTQNSTDPAETTLAPAPAPAPAPVAPMENGNPANPEQPPPGGIICVPVRFNETDPNDATKMIEVEKIACYPAPPAPPAQPQVPGEVVDLNKQGEPVAAATPAEGSAPLAPMQPLTPGASSQQLQQESTMVGDQKIKSATDDAGIKDKSLFAFVMCFAINYLIAYN